MITNANLVVITVHKGLVQTLKKTLRSIDRQICAPSHNIVVARNTSLYQVANFQRENRTFIFNKDKSIYNAMNIGLRNKIINNKFVIFLNSGDVFFNNKVIYDIKKYFTRTAPIAGQQILRYNNNYYKIRKIYSRKKNYLAHGAFFSPPIKKNSVSTHTFFLENHKIDADGIWMKTIIHKSFNSPIKVNKNISILSLGGVSTNPNISSVLHYKKINFKCYVKELLKLILKLILGKTLYYRVIYLFKFKHEKKQI